MYSLLMVNIGIYNYNIIYVRNSWYTKNIIKHLKLSASAFTAVK